MLIETADVAGLRGGDTRRSGGCLYVTMRRIDPSDRCATHFSFFLFYHSLVEVLPEGGCCAEENMFVRST